MRLRPALPLLLAALGACSQQADEQAPPPTPTPSLTSQALLTQAADGTPLAAGEWLVEETGNGASRESCS